MEIENLLRAAAVSAALLCSCNKTPDFIPELSVVCKGEKVEAGSSTEIQAGFNGDMATFKLSANCGWTASCEEDWVEVSPAEGESGDHPVKITVNANQSFALRTAAVKIALKDHTEMACTINVRQGADEPFINVAPESVEFEAEGESKTVTVESNCSWTAVSSEAWVVADVSEGEAGSTTVTLTAAANTTADFRTARLVVANSEHNLSKEVPVKQSPDLSDWYVDEYGINHGKGIKIGETMWAPVNCGYKAAADGKPGNPYGKYYQWGRSAGFGYNTDDIEEDALAINVDGPVASVEEALAENFYKNSPNWLAQEVSNLWNAGTEEKPVKTSYDPCPDGWRVPTSTEMKALTANGLRWLSAAGAELPADSGEMKHWGFSGQTAYGEASAKVLFPVAGWIAIGSNARDRGTGAFYWTSSTDDSKACGLQAWANWNDPGFSHAEKARGCNVRCVKE